MSNWPIAVQIIGFIAMAVGLFSYQPKRRSRILQLQMITNILWAVHFILLGATTGAILNVLSGVRAFLFNRYASRKNHSQLLLILMLLGFVIGGIVTWQGYMSLLPITGVIISTLAFWRREEQQIRLILFFTSPFWLTYNILSGSYPGVINESIAMLSIIIALYRHRRQGFTRQAVQKTS